VLGAHVQQQGLTEAALRAFERERIPRVKAIFGLAAAQAAKIRAGVPQRELLDERAELLYGQASFRPLQRAAGSGGGGEAAGAGAGGAAVSAQLAA
jgi:2-polyprenyl-6-methoxyphenol hydroxylase-like FAD-dependent oxidoreductase